MQKVEKLERLAELEASISFHKFAIRYADKEEECDYSWHTRQIYDLLKIKKLHTENN